MAADFAKVLGDSQAVNTLFGAFCLASGYEENTPISHMLHLPDDEWTNNIRDFYVVDHWMEDRIEKREEKKLNQAQRGAMYSFRDFINKFRNPEVPPPAPQPMLTCSAVFDASCARDVAAVSGVSNVRAVQLSMLIDPMDNRVAPLLTMDEYSQCLWRWWDAKRTETPPERDPFRECRSAIKSLSPTGSASRDRFIQTVQTENAR